MLLPCFLTMPSSTVSSFMPSSMPLPSLSILHSPHHRPPLTMTEPIFFFNPSIHSAITHNNSHTSNHHLAATMPKPVHSKYPTINNIQTKSTTCLKPMVGIPQPPWLFHEAQVSRGRALSEPTAVLHYRQSSSSPSSCPSSRSADEPRLTPRHRFPHRCLEPKPARILSLPSIPCSASRRSTKHRLSS
ncbi:hypothetical protein M0R45_009106 [Rubus argutus]|uniref:Uncharacterized protein n=1 Tax=Rubus argutus TaxID=59490 RepID=A0AAW1Y629_RUBAR